MNNRQLAIINFVDDRLPIVNKMIESLQKTNQFDSITVYTNKQREYVNGVTINVVDSDWSRSKIKNFVNYFTYSNGFRGFLHVLEDNIEILKDPTEFILDIENMMEKFDYNIWFNTVCDECNYVLDRKYSPRFILREVNTDTSLRAKAIVNTTHCNTKWTIFRLCAEEFQKDQTNLFFDEKYTIPMFYILERLSRRRAHRGIHQPYFYNSYLTVDSENGVFKPALKSNQNFAKELFEKEDKIFRESRINITPDTNVDVVIETLYNKLGICD